MDTFAIADEFKKAVRESIVNVGEQSSAQADRHAEEKHSQSMRHRDEMHEQSLKLRGDAHQHNLKTAKKHKKEVAPEYLYGGGFNYNVVNDQDEDDEATSGESAQPSGGGAAPSGGDSGDAD